MNVGKWICHTKVSRSWSQLTSTPLNSIVAMKVSHVSQEWSWTISSCAVAECIKLSVSRVIECLPPKENVQTTAS